VHEFRSDGCVRHAAATSYFAILSFLPFVVLMLSGVGFVLSALGSSPEEEKRLLDGILRTTQGFAPFLEEDLRQRVRDLVGVREAFGAVGAVVLLFTSSLVFGAIEDSLGAVFRAPRPRHMVVSKLLALVFVAAFGVLLLLGRWALALTDALLDVAGVATLSESMISSDAVGMVLSFIGTVAAFGILVRYFAPMRLAYGRLLGGAAVFFLLWEAAKHVFTVYLAYVARFSMLYGSVSAIMVLVIWVFYSACIFLYCAEVVKVLESDAVERRQPKLL